MLLTRYSLLLLHLSSTLTHKVSDVAAIALHGEMEQERRTSILSGFLNGRYDVVVATGILARGLDLKNVRQVLV